MLDNRQNTMDGVRSLFTEREALEAIWNGPPPTAPPGTCAFFDPQSIEHFCSLVPNVTFDVDYGNWEVYRHSSPGDTSRKRLALLALSEALCLPLRNKIGKGGARYRLLAAATYFESLLEPRVISAEVAAKISKGDELLPSLLAAAGNDFFTQLRVDRPSSYPGRDSEDVYATRVAATLAWDLGLKLETVYNQVEQLKTLGGDDSDLRDKLYEIEQIQDKPVQNWDKVFLILILMKTVRNIEFQIININYNLKLVKDAREEEERQRHPWNKFKRAFNKFPIWNELAQHHDTEKGRLQQKAIAAGFL